MNAANVFRLSESCSVKQSSLAFKAACKKTVCCEKSCFWQGKNCVILHYYWNISTKICYKLFIKTIRIISTCGKWASVDHFQAIGLHNYNRKSWLESGQFQSVNGMGKYFSYILFRIIFRGANNCGQCVLEKNNVFHNKVSPSLFII